MTDVLTRLRSTQNDVVCPCLDLRTAAADEIAQLKAALKRYGRHTISCPATGIFAPPENAPYCTCGFEAITVSPQSPVT